MSNVDVAKLLDPLGADVREAMRGRWGVGRVEVTVMWPHIEKALDAGARVSAVWEELSRQGLVSVTKRTFARRVNARREGAKNGAAGEPSTAQAGREAKGSRRKAQAERPTRH